MSGIIRNAFSQSLKPNGAILGGKRLFKVSNKSPTGFRFGWNKQRGSSSTAEMKASRRAPIRITILANAKAKEAGTSNVKLRRPARHHEAYAEEVGMSSLTAWGWNGWSGCRNGRFGSRVRCFGLRSSRANPTMKD